LALLLGLILLLLHDFIKRQLGRGRKTPWIFVVFCKWILYFKRWLSFSLFFHICVTSILFSFFRLLLLLLLLFLMDFFLLFTLLWLMLFWNICGYLFWSLLCHRSLNLLFCGFLLFFNHINFFLLSTLLLLLLASWLSLWLLLVNLTCHVSFRFFINFDFFLMQDNGRRRYILLWRYHIFLLLLLLLVLSLFLLFSSLLSFTSTNCRADLFSDLCLCLCLSGCSSSSTSQIFFQV